MVNKNLVVENGRIAFRNFAGEESKYNRKGNRNFCVIFDKEQGEELLAQGWNMKLLQARNEDEEDSYMLQVTVAYGKISPKIYLISGRKKTLMDEDSVGIIDYAEIETVDMVIRPYNWEVNGKTGVKAYIKDMYVVIREDIFTNKYNFENEYEEF